MKKVKIRTYDKDKEEMTDVTGMTFDIENMIFAMPVSHNNVVKGDIIIHLDKAAVVKEIKKSSVVVYPFNSEIKEIIPKKSIFGFNFYTKITSFIDPGSNCFRANEDNPFGNPMMMMAMMGNQGGNNPFGSNPITMMAMTYA